MAKESNVRKVSFKVSGKNLPAGFSVIIPAEIDFTGVTQDQLVEWALSKLKIDLQSWLRDRSPEFLTELSTKGYKCHATQCGQAAKSPAEKAQELANSLNIPLELATIIVNDPGKLAALMAKAGK